MPVNCQEYQRDYNSIYTQQLDEKKEKKFLTKTSHFIRKHDEIQ